MTLVDEASVYPHLGEVLEINAALLAATRAWANGGLPGPEVATARGRALALNHRRYIERIPAYHDLASREGRLGPVALQTRSLAVGNCPNTVVPGT